MFFPEAFIYQFDAVDYPKEELSDCKFFKVSLGDSEKESNFYKKEESGDSIFKQNISYLSDHGDVYDESDIIKTQLTTLDKFASEHDIPKADFVKIDVQGAELLILKGSPKIIDQANFLLLELSYVEFNLGGCLIEDVLPYIRNKGFKPIAFSHLNGNSYEIIQSDILFQRIK